MHYFWHHKNPKTEIKQGLWNCSSVFSSHQQSRVANSFWAGICVDVLANPQEFIQFYSVLNGLGKFSSSCMYCYHHFYLHVGKCHNFVKDQTIYAEDCNAFFKQNSALWCSSVVNTVTEIKKSPLLIIFCVCGSVPESLILKTWALSMLSEKFFFQCFILSYMSNYFAWLCWAARFSWSFKIAF